MDLSAVILVVLSSLPVFFFWRWILRKHIEVKRYRLIVIWIATIISTPILYAILALMFIGIIEYYPNRDFDKKAWLTDSDKRYEYTYDLISSKLLIGKSKIEVVRMLGKTDTTQTNELYYYIGYKPVFTGIDPSNIEVDFRKGKVNNVEEHDK